MFDCDVRLAKRAGLSMESFEVQWSYKSEVLQKSINAIKLQDNVLKVQQEPDIKRALNAVTCK